MNNPTNAPMLIPSPSATPESLPVYTQETPIEPTKGYLGVLPYIDSCEDSTPHVYLHELSMPGIRMILSAEQTEQLRTVAKTLGGFSVQVRANVGEEYPLPIPRFTSSGQAIFEPRYEYVDEGDVYVEMTNTGNPKASQNLQDLWDAHEAQFPKTKE